MLLIQTTNMVRKFVVNHENQLKFSSGSLVFPCCCSAAWRCKLSCGYPNVLLRCRYYMAGQTYDSILRDSDFNATAFSTFRYLSFSIFFPLLRLSVYHQRFLFGVCVCVFWSLVLVCSLHIQLSRNNLVLLYLFNCSSGINLCLCFYWFYFDELSIFRFYTFVSFIYFGFWFCAMIQPIA